jgi:transposase
MNYNQQRKIQQVTENTLIVGADIAKHKHIARAQDYRGIELGKKLAFENSRTGFNRLLDWIRQLQQDHQKEEVIFGVEPTGHYWFSLAQFLKKAGIKVVVVNSMHVKKSKELDDNSPTKNDTKDARVIAQLVKDGRYSEPKQLTGAHAELRIAITQREQLMTKLTQTKNQIQNWVDCYFPEYQTVFKNWEGKASLITLQLIPMPQDIMEHQPAEIVAMWRAGGVQRTVGIKRANQLIATARISIGLTEGSRMAHSELKMLLEQYTLFMNQLDELAQNIAELLKNIPGADNLLSIPGLGWVTVAGFLGEVGDLASYAHPKQIIKLAGLNLKENSSGKHKGRTQITKRGRRRLRAVLFRSVLILVAKNQEFRRLHQYYISRAENPLKKKQSLVALCCKLIRIMFGIGRTCTDYDPSKVIKTDHPVWLQEAA